MQCSPSNVVVLLFNTSQNGFTHHISIAITLLAPTFLDIVYSIYLYIYIYSICVCLRFFLLFFFWVCWETGPAVFSVIIVLLCGASTLNLFEKYLQSFVLLFQLPGGTCSNCEQKLSQDFQISLIVKALPGSNTGLYLLTEVLSLNVMKITKWLASVLMLTIAMLATAFGAFVGVNIGTDVSDLPPASTVVAILKAHQITHVRLYDANAQLLRALSNTGIEVIVGVTNEEVLMIGESPSAAAAWINKNVVAYVPLTNITSIAVGSEVLSTIPNVAPVLVPAMNSLHKALVAANLHSRVKVSTPQSMDIIPRPFPPSTATFNSSWNSTIFQLLQFLKNTNSSYMLNAYPYYGYTKGDGIFPIEYALFKPLPSVKQIVDPNTLFHYDSMFDAMVDATYYSIEGFHFNDIPIVVTETGWPWFGGANEPDAIIENAETYNNNLFLRVLNDSGPPSQPDKAINTYIYELFNEDKRNGPISEKNWGIFYTNGSTVYPLSFGSSNRVNGFSASVFCVAKDGAPTDKLQDGLNWACGQGQANCAAIQPGKPCYLPNNLKTHASFAYNDYYQKAHSAGGTCDFNGSATVTSQDPSYGSCIYTGSSSTGRESLPPTALGPSSPEGASWNLQVSSLQYMTSAIYVFLAMVVL